MMGAGSPFTEIPFEYLEKGIMAIFERKGADVVEMNLKALRAGREFAQITLNNRIWGSLLY